jgi:hypothetical protein
MVVDSYNCNVFVVRVFNVFRAKQFSGAVYLYVILGQENLPSVNFLERKRFLIKTALVLKTAFNMVSLITRLLHTFIKATEKYGKKILF